MRIGDASVSKISLEVCVIAFQGAYENELEYGINDEDCAAGLRAAFSRAGIEYDDDALFLHGNLSSAEEIAENDRRQEELAKFYEAHSGVLKMPAAMAAVIERASLDRGTA